MIAVAYGSGLSGGVEAGWTSEGLRDLLLDAVALRFWRAQGSISMGQDSIGRFWEAVCELTVCWPS